MRKERIKTIILTLLILNCLHLTGQIWFNKKLWPTGYNFFSSVANNAFVSGILKVIPIAGTTFSPWSAYADAIRPPSIVVSSEKARQVFRHGQKQYDNIWSTSGDVVVRLLKTDTPRSAVIETREWNNMLNGNSIFINLGVAMDAASFAGLFGQQTGTIFPDGMMISQFLITGDNVMKDGIVCFRDASSGVITKYWVDYNEDDLFGKINSATFGKSKVGEFVFDHKMDTPSLNPNFKRTVYFDSQVLLPQADEIAQNMTVFNPIDGSADSFDKIVSVLGYTPSSLRKRVSLEGVASYVENSATIKISPNGLVEYSAVDADKGIPLQSSSQQPHKIVGEIVVLASKLMQAAGDEHPLDIYLVSDLRQGSSLTVTMNYSYNGLPVIVQTDNGGHAVYAQVENGHITSFKMVLRTFNKADGSIAFMSFYNAVDILSKRFAQNNDPVKIDDFFNCYYVLDDAVLPAWGAKIAGSDEAFIVTQE